VIMDLQASNVLLCLRYGIGDVVMELPILDRLREALPQATITGLGAEPAIEVLEGDDRLDTVVSIRRWGIRHLGDPVDDHFRRQLAAWLQDSRFDLVLDPSHAAHAVMDTVYQQDIPRRDADRASIEAGLAQGGDGLAAIKHAIHLTWGLEIPASAHPIVRPRLQEVEWASRFLEERELACSLVAVSPNASDDLKRWPLEHLVRLCVYLAEDLGAGVLVFCGPEEAGLLGAFGKRLRDLPRLEIVPNLHLRRVVALLSQCGLYVGNDSGLMHLAAAAGTPVVILFGPTSPRLYLPGWVRSRAVASPVACPHRPELALGHPPCVLGGSCLLDTPCIQAVDPAQVYAAVKEEYARR